MDTDTIGLIVLVVPVLMVLAAAGAQSRGQRD
jgi:hypothetical protein